MKRNYEKNMNKLLDKRNSLPGARISAPNDDGGPGLNGRTGPGVPFMKVLRLGAAAI